MNIDPKSMIAGQPALKIRSFFRKADSSSWNAGFVAEALSITLKEARSIIQELCRLGYIEQSTQFPNGPWWKTTLQGNALAMASATRPLKRSTAARELSAFLDRVQQINADPYYLYKIRKVLLFGSMLTDAAHVGDVDLAVELVYRIDDIDGRGQAHQERIESAIRDGRRFSNKWDQLAWPQHEVILFLKSGSRVLSLHDTDDPILEMVPTRVIFEDLGPNTPVQEVQ
jgi:hypothetical protein